MGTVYTQEMLTDEMYAKLSTLTALVDCDSVVYRSGFAADGQFKREYKENHPDATKEEIDAYLATLDYEHVALHNAKETLTLLASIFDAQKMRVFLTGKDNYRDKVASIQQYKGNRDPTHKPRYYKQLREYLIKHWNAEVVDGMEADDMVSILQWAAKDKSTIIASIDKDLLNTAGHHWNINKHEYQYVTLTEANIRFWSQVATGDGVDNIAGLKGVGPKTVEKWAEQAEHNPALLEQRVREEYDKRHGDAGASLLHEMATLCWMQRVPNVNYDGSKLSEYQYEDYNYGNEEGSEEAGQHLLDSQHQELPDVESPELVQH